MPADEVATACVDAGMAPLAAALIRAKAGREAVAKRLDEAREITALAQAAGRPADAGDLILAGVSVDVARATLTAARAQGAPTINPHAPADNPPRTQDDPKAELGKRLDFTTIYARRQAVGKAA